MIHDVDQSIRDLLDEQIVRGANIDIAFDAPNQEWAGKRQGPALNVFLYDVREDVDRRQVQYEARTDEDGIVVGRYAPARRFKLEYLLTTWAQRPEDEHRLLSAVLELFLATDYFPRQYLRGGLAAVGDLRMTIGLPLPSERRLTDVWGVLGVGLRPVLDLSITVPFGGRSDPHVGPPVLEGPRISVLGPDGLPVTPMRPPGGRSVADSPQDAARDDAVPDDAKPDRERAADPPVVREVLDGGRFRGGRRVVELTEDDVQPGRRIGISTMPRQRT